MCVALDESFPNIGDRLPNLELTAGGWVESQGRLKREERRYFKQWIPRYPVIGHVGLPIS
jgi:hypothetical protein